MLIAWRGALVRRILSATVLAACLTILSASAAARGQDKPQELKATVLLSGLNHPCGVAIQPGTGDVLISESGGGRILRTKNLAASGGNSVEPHTAITGFAASESTLGFKAGPLGLAFYDKETLLVGGADLGPGKDVIRDYILTDKPLTVADAKFQIGPIASADGKSGYGGYYALALTGAVMYATATGDPASGAVCKAVLTDGKFGDLKPFVIANAESGAPRALTISPRGELVVNQRPAKSQTDDLVFYNAKSGRLLMRLPLSLRNVLALEYSPKTGRLYALASSADDDAGGGLFRLDSALEDNRPAVKALKLLPLERSTAMAFSADHVLYVTTLGKAGPGEKSGQLVAISGEL